VRALARSPLAIVASAIWGYAEATRFWLVPDILLAWIALNRSCFTWRTRSACARATWSDGTSLNRSDDTHLFHIHDVQFQILDRGGAAPGPTEVGRKDTVMVRPGENVSLLMRFEDYADPAMPYMFHCHILQHEDQGMMGQFVVVPA